MVEVVVCGSLNMDVIVQSARRPKAGETSFKPSTADSTEMAGVMTASP